MGGAEGVVDVDLGQAGQLLREAGVVGLLLGMEAQVLEQEHLARPQTARSRLDRGADAVGDRLDGAAQQLGQAHGHRRHAEAVDHLALGPAEMRREHDRTALLEEVRDGRQGGADARVVGHAAALERHVEVHPHEETRLPASG